jgi:prevent-host-death family protein
MSAMTAREFNRDVSAAKRAALKAPVMITDRGNPAFVLVSIEEYRKLRGEDTGQSLLDRLSMDEDIDFEPTRLRFVPKEAEL